nr:hypothetical protein Itr_chr11CG05260 [Ipomoea trifida]
MAVATQWDHVGNDVPTHQAATPHPLRPNEVLYHLHFYYFLILIMDSFKSFLAPRLISSSQDSGDIIAGADELAAHLAAGTILSGVGPVDVHQQYMEYEPIGVVFSSPDFSVSFLA